MERCLAGKEFVLDEVGNLLFQVVILPKFLSRVEGSFWRGILRHPAGFIDERTTFGSVIAVRA